MSIFRLIPPLLAVLLYGCAATPKQSVTVNDSSKALVDNKVASKNKYAPDKNAIDPDVMFMLLTAELAGQRGQYDIALEGYLEAAKRVKDPKLSERAAIIGMYIKDEPKTGEAVSLWLKQEPTSIDARKIAAFSALKAGDKTAAVSQFNGLLEKNPADFEKTVFELIGALPKDNNLPFVYDIMEELSVKHPNQAAIYMAQSILAADMKKIAVADRKVAQALKIQPDWDKALMLQAQLALYSEDFAKAEALLKSTSEKYPENPKFKKMLAQALIKAGKYEDAGVVYEGLIEADPQDLESQFSLGLVHMELGKDSQAEDVFKQLINKPEWQNQSAFYLGKLEEKRDNPEKALVWYGKVNDGPFEFEAAITAIALLGKNKQYDVAEQHLNALATKFPRQKIRVTLIQAEIYSQQKQYDKAYNYLTEALNVSPDQEELLYSRALMADRMNKIDLMEADLRKILAKSPDNVEALNALGYGLSEKTTRYQEAEGYLIHALRLKPDEAVILDSYGWLKYKMGDLPVALDYLQRAYDKQAEPEIAAHLAEVMMRLGKKDDARKIYDKAIADHPDDSYLLDFNSKFLQ